MAYNRVFGKDGKLYFKGRGQKPSGNKKAVAASVAKDADVEVVDDYVYNCSEYLLAQALETLLGVQIRLFYVDLVEWSFTEQPKWMQEDDYAEGQYIGWNSLCQQRALENALASDGYMAEMFAKELRDIRVTCGQTGWKQLSFMAFKRGSSPIIREVGPLPGVQAAAEATYILEKSFPLDDTSAPACAFRRLGQLSCGNRSPRLLLLGRSKLCKGYLLVGRW